MKTAIRSFFAWALVALTVMPPFANATLVNLSTRMTVAENEVLISGFVVSVRSRVLIRAVGPGLAIFGVPDTMVDPNLQVYSGQTQIWGNDDWRVQSTRPGEAPITAQAIEAAQLQVGAFAIQNDDAATIMTLEPGPYTVQIRERFGRKGGVLVEVYKLP